MRTKKKMKRISALVLSAALSVSVLLGVHAASAVETDRTDCSITFSVSEEQFPEFTTEDVMMDVKLYKVADMTVSGTFTPLKGFDSLEIPSISYNEDLASVWAKRAEEIFQLITDQSIEPTATVRIEGGTGTASDLATGLYLVAGETAQSSNYMYDFIPYLVSLPYNYYQPDDPDSSDEWVYDITQSPKLEQTDLYGDLIIHKTLDRYNAALGPVSFIFRVEAVRNDGRPDPVVYSDVAALTFDGSGEKSIKITNIPVGAVVTVTELSMSGSYHSVSGNERTVTILADEVMTVDFENDYNNGMIGESAVINQFTNTDRAGNWRWDQWIGDEVVRTEGGLDNEEQSE